MADKIGSGALEYMAKLGLNELRAANSGQEVEAPTKPPDGPQPEAPQAEAPAQQSYVAMLDRQADQAQSQSPEQGGLER